MNNRRTVLGLLAGAALTLCLSLPAFAPAAVAAEASPARKALEVSISRVLDCIKNPDYVNPATRPPLRRQIEDEVYHIFDFGEFSSRTVGPRWKEFSAAQKKSFSNAFADLLLTTYLNKRDRQCRQDPCGSPHRDHHEGRHPRARGLPHDGQGQQLARL